MQVGDFATDPLDVITLRDGLQALTALNQDTVLLDYGHVIIRKGYSALKTVRLLGGGVGGTDLSQAVFVGEGMFTAAIFGEAAVPTSRHILRTIKELDEGANYGIFVIVQANADLFNFGLAVERANANCRTRVKLIAIDDDKGDKKARYSCGYILLTKILGAMAEKGATYHDMCQFYQNVLCDHIATVPLCYFEKKLLQHKRSLVLRPFEQHVRMVIDAKSEADLHLHPSIPAVALINTSKTLDRLGELGLVKRVVERVRQLGVCLERIYYGTFVSQRYETASLTIMKVFDKKVIEYLDAPTHAPGWRRFVQHLPEISIANEVPGLLQRKGKEHVELKGPHLTVPQTGILLKSMQFACDALISCERQLNTIDAEKSQGNVGTRFRTMAEDVNKRLDGNRLPSSCPYAFFKKMGCIAESALGGTMGSIYGVLFERAAGVFAEMPEGEIVTPFVWARVLTSVVGAVKRYYTKDTAERTMFYPLLCSELAINREIAKDSSYLVCYGVGVGVAEDSASKTKLPDWRYPDAGAHAVGIWMRAVFEGVKLLTGSDICEDYNV